MAMLTKDQILQASDLGREVVEVPEWGGDVYVSAMTAADRDAFEASLVKDGERNMDNMRARLAAMTMVDEKGERLFTDAEASKLGKKSAAALTRVFSVAMRMNGIGDSDVEELAGN
ncbi:MAG: hypothetical protein R6U98_24285 [Pirellulaceae bacterium]